MGRLDLITIILGVFAIFIGIAAFSGFWMIRSAAMHAAQRATPESVKEYLQEHRIEIIQASFSDPQTVARLQAAIMDLGLGGTIEAEYVDEDATTKETEND